MNVVCRIQRVSGQETASALLLQAGPRELLALCGQLRLTQFPVVHRVAGGFLIKLPAPLDQPIAGATRLGALASNLFVPVEAELLPALTAEEAAGLSRERGLVFLPTGLLEYNPTETVALAQLVTAQLRPRRRWEALPMRQPLAERIVSIRLDLPDDEPEAILERAGSDEDIGVESPPRPEDASLPARAAGQAMAGFGRALHGLGSFLGWKGLANLGASWVQKATALVPRLSESLLGRQEAALRELLRQFRSGNIDQALRRALPLGGGETERGPTVPYTSSQLPWHQLSFSLSGLFGGGRGVTPIWYGGQDVQRELANEYRRAAELACQKGDFRRAAFIYGRLLGDYQAAANALLRGQLFHEAAVLYLRKLNDRRAAARAFEQAGEFDTALELWRQLGDHLSAGDLLQRMGDEEAALREFRAAADELAQRKEYLPAYQLMVNRARRPDLGRAYLEQGWLRRPDSNGVICGSRLAQHLVEEEDVAAFQVVLAEGRSTFARLGGDEAAAQFFNAMVLLAERPALESVRADVRDACLLGLAGRLKQRSANEAAPGDVASTLFGRSTAWPIPLVGDARFAFGQAVAQRPINKPTPVPDNLVQVGSGIVTAIGQVQGAGDLLVGCRSGDVFGFAPGRSQVYRICSGSGFPVIGLAATANGELVAVLSGDDLVQLTTYACESSSSPYRGQASFSYHAGAHGWLAPQIRGRQGTQIVDCGDQRRLYSMDATTLSAQQATAEQEEFAIEAALCSPFSSVYFVSDGRSWCCWSSPGSSDSKLADALPWGAALPLGSSLLRPTFAWRVVSDVLSLAGVDRDGKVRLSHLPSGLRTSSHYCSATNERYRAATIVRPGLLAAAADHAVAWFRKQGNQLVHAAPSTPLPGLTGVVGCFVSPRTNEVLVVARDGQVARIYVPAGI